MSLPREASPVLARNRRSGFLIPLLVIGCATSSVTIDPPGSVSPIRPSGDARLSSDRLVASYDMSTLTSDGRLRDLTLNGMHATIAGTERVPGASGGALRFRQATDRVELPSRAGFDLDGPLSVVTRFRFDRSGQHQHVVAYDDKFALWLTPDDHLRFVNTLGDGAETEEALSPDKWHSVIGVFRGTAGDAIDESNTEIWVDGIKVPVDVASARGTGTPRWKQGALHPKDACYIGFESHQGDLRHQGLPFFGVIDEVMIFARALAPTEVSLLAAPGR